LLAGDEAVLVRVDLIEPVAEEPRSLVPAQLAVLVRIGLLEHAATGGRPAGTRPRSPRSTGTSAAGPATAGPTAAGTSGGLGEDIVGRANPLVSGEALLAQGEARDLEGRGDLLGVEFPVEDAVAHVGPAREVRPPAGEAECEVDLGDRPLLL